VATAPAGVGLCLVGGFRYRLLDRPPAVAGGGAAVLATVRTLLVGLLPALEPSP